MVTYYIDSSWTGSSDGTIDNPYTSTTGAISAAGTGGHTFWYRRTHQETFSAEVSFEANPDPSVPLRLVRYDDHVSGHTWNSDPETGRPKFRFDDGTADGRFNFTDSHGVYLSGLQMYHTRQTASDIIRYAYYLMVDDIWFRHDDPTGNPNYGVPPLAYCRDTYIKNCEICGYFYSDLPFARLFEGNVVYENCKIACTNNDNTNPVQTRSHLDQTFIGCKFGPEAFPGTYAFTYFTRRASSYEYWNSARTEAYVCAIPTGLVETSTSLLMNPFLAGDTIFMRSGDSTDHIFFNAAGSAKYSTAVVYSDSEASIEVETKEGLTGYLGPYAGFPAVKQPVASAGGTYSSIKLYVRQSGWPSDTNWASAVRARLYYWDSDSIDSVALTGAVPSGSWGYLEGTASFTAPSGASMYLIVTIHEHAPGAKLWFDERPRLS